MYLVQLTLQLWVNPQNVYCLFASHDANVAKTGITFMDGSVEYVEMSVQEVANKLNGLDDKYTIRHDPETLTWTCNVIGHPLRTGIGDSPQEALDDAIHVERIRSPKPPRN